MYAYIIYIHTPIEHLLNYITKSDIKIIISNYVNTFTKIDVEILTFYKIMIIVCSINFEIIFRQNYDNVVNHFSDIFTKLNLEKNCLIY